jgi:Tol biopolymer transport system component
MTRWLLHSLALAALLCCLYALPALGQSAIDLSDDFDDGVLDSSKWFAATWPEGTGTVEERDGMLVMTRQAGDYCADQLWSLQALRGAFDVQVDYQLLEWPESRYLGVLLVATTVDDHSTVSRYQNTGWDGYAAAYREASERIPGGIYGTTDTSGTLRLVRDADDNLTGYFWSAEAASWVAFESAVAPGDTTMMLWFSATADQPASVAFDNFQVNSGEIIPIAPGIEEVRIDRGRSRSLWRGASGYQQRLSTTVSATALMPIACVIINDPSGGQYVMSPCAGGGWADWYSPGAGLVTFWVSQDPDYTVHCGFSETDRETPPDPGSYTVRVLYGDELTYTTPATPAIPEGESAVSLLLPSLDTVIDDPAPLFQWTGAAGGENRVRLRADGLRVSPPADAEGYVWDASVGEATQAAYTGPALEPGHTYLWQAESSVPLDNGVTDPLVSIWQTDLARGRFTEYLDYPTTLPSLPGRLAWTEVISGTWNDDFSVLSYSPDPWVRLWLSPEGGESPSFTWDGSALLYGGGWVDLLDGSRATRIPGMEGSYDTCWSPDATRITFTDNGDMFMLNADGSDLHTLLATEDNERRADWSPDGRWLAYRKVPSDGYPASVRLMRPDGSEDHEVVATGVSGYPDYAVLTLADPTWSPDATRLAVSFSATLPDGTSRDGIGTISPEGGVLTPVFVTPPGYVCCASPMLPQWSADGASIVFSSGHHLDIDPDWQNGRFEHGVELWVTDADGSGEPVRLTYNYCYDSTVGWWAPNTPVGKQVSVVKGEASVTFAQVTAEGSTRMNVTDDVPGPAPEGYAFASDVWSGATTAGYQGDVTIALQYDVSLDAHSLALMQWNPAKAKWQDITARPVDLADHIIRGRTKDLGVSAVCARTR